MFRNIHCITNDINYLKKISKLYLNIDEKVDASQQEVFDV